MHQFFFCLSKFQKFPFWCDYNGEINICEGAEKGTKECWREKNRNSINIPLLFHFISSTLRHSIINIGLQIIFATEFNFRTVREHSEKERSEISCLAFKTSSEFGNFFDVNPLGMFVISFHPNQPVLQTHAKKSEEVRAEWISSEQWRVNSNKVSEKASQREHVASEVPILCTITTIFPHVHFLIHTQSCRPQSFRVFSRGVSSSGNNRLHLVECRIIAKSRRKRIKWVKLDSVSHTFATRLVLDGIKRSARVRMWESENWENEI